MKIKVFTLIALAFTLLSNRGGRNLPAVAAPGDGPGTCAQCHGGGNFDPEVTLQLKDNQDNVVDTYNPGKTYTMEVIGNVSGGSIPNGYGFQMVVLDDTENNQAGEFISYGNNVRNNIVNQRNYVMQSAPRQDGTFTAEWVAPAENTGKIRIYVSLLAINGNNNITGDRVINTSYSFQEGVVSDIDEISDERLSLYPNPTAGLLYFNHESGPVNIFDTQGRLVFRGEIINRQLDLRMLKKGVYFIMNEQKKVERLIKI